MSKMNKLKKILRDMQRVLVAYSGGVDSNFLLKIAVDTLGERNVIAVTDCSQTYQKSEFRQAKRRARALGVRHLTTFTDELKDTRFTSNPKNRCYFCKKHLFGRLKKMARERGIKYVLDASTVDDLKDYRPGSKAARELGVRSPLQEAGFTKADIRRRSRRLGLDTWNKPSMACLASRFAYGQKITQETLTAIEKAEGYLLRAGFREVRVRVHGGIARVEVARSDIKRLINPALRDKIIRRLKTLGFTYITLDLEGYRSGSLNEVLK